MGIFFQRNGVKIFKKRIYDKRQASRDVGELFFVDENLEVLEDLVDARGSE